MRATRKLRYGVLTHSRCQHGSNIDLSYVEAKRLVGYAQMLILRFNVIPLPKQECVLVQASAGGAGIGVSQEQTTYQVVLLSLTRLLPELRIVGPCIEENSQVSQVISSIEDRSRWRRSYRTQKVR